MIESLKSQLEDWKYGRGIIKDFINHLEDSDLDKLFPRENLNTIRKQCEELIQIQGCYLEALKTKKINFDYEPIADVSNTSLLEKMDALDFELQKELEKFNGTETIDWGEKWNIHRHISAMIGHEQMHIGQIVAFCYSVKIKIPDIVVKKMALDG